MANTGAKWQHDAHTTDQLLAPDCRTRAIPYTEAFSGEIKKLGEWASRKRDQQQQQQQKDRKSNGSRQKNKRGDSKVV